MWKDVFAPIGGMAFAAWLIRSIVKLYLSKDLEHHKAQLKTDSDKELEELRTSLHKTAYEHEVRFRGLHDRRADVIQDLYKRLVEAQRATALLLTVSSSEAQQSKKQKYESAGEKVRELATYFDRNRIYFAEELCASKIDELVQELQVETSVLEMDFGTDLYRDTFRKALRKFGKEIPQMRRELEGQFRDMIGVDRGQPVGGEG